MPSASICNRRDSTQEARKMLAGDSGISMYMTRMARTVLCLTVVTQCGRVFMLFQPDRESRSSIASRVLPRGSWTHRYEALPKMAGSANKGLYGLRRGFSPCAILAASVQSAMQAAGVYAASDWKALSDYGA